MPEPSRLRAAVFLDRDGTICEEAGYLNHLSRFRMFPLAPAALRRPVVVCDLTQAADSILRKSA